MPARHPRRQRQSGFALIELGVALAIVAILAVLGAQHLVNELDDRQGEAAGSYGLAIKGALDAYMNTHATQLQSGAAISGFANSLSPTVEELRAAGFLPSAYPLIDPLRRRYVTELRVTGCPGACEISAIAYSNTPITERCTSYAGNGSCQTTAGNVKLRVVEAFRSTARGYGAAVTPLDASRFRGSVCDYPTPSGAALGTYGICTSDNSAIYAQFVRIQDSRDPDLQGDLTVAGKVTAKGGADIENGAIITGGADITGGVDVTGDLVATGTVTAQSLRPRGSAWLGASCTAGEKGTIMQNGGTSSHLLVCNGSNWVVLGNEIAGHGAACSTSGKTVVTTSGQTLVCRDGYYQYLDSMLGNFLLVDVIRAVEGQQINKPTCDITGSPYVVLVTKSETNSAGSFNRYVDDSGSYWTVRIRDAAGVVVNNGEVLAHTYCQYGS
ncbi:type II secretion system protein [Corticibacter populi]|nr:type II secretion system protein [Corticibacter populi]